MIAIIVSSAYYSLIVDHAIVTLFILIHTLQSVNTWSDSRGQKVRLVS